MIVSTPQATAPGAVATPRAKEAVSVPGFWTLNRLLALIVIAGYAFLFLDVRYEHRNILGGEWEVWIPILFAGAAMLTGALTLAFWERGGRIVFAALSSIAFVVGFLGVWHHTDGNPFKVFQVLSPSSPSSSTVPMAGESQEGGEGHSEGEEEGEEGERSQTTTAIGETATANAPDSGVENENKAPLLAPLAFAGIGLLGLLAASRRFHSEAGRLPATAE